MGGLDLCEGDPREEKEERDPRSDHRPESIEPEERRSHQCNARVEADERSAPGEDPDGDRRRDPARRRALAEGREPERSQAGDGATKEAER